MQCNLKFFFSIFLLTYEKTHFLFALFNSWNLPCFKLIWMCSDVYFEHICRWIVKRNILFAWGVFFIIQVTFFLFLFGRAFFDLYFRSKQKKNNIGCSQHNKGFYVTNNASFVKNTIIPFYMVQKIEKLNFCVF